MKIYIFRWSNTNRANARCFWGCSKMRNFKHAEFCESQAQHDSQKTLDISISLLVSFQQILSHTYIILKLLWDWHNSGYFIALGKILKWAPYHEKRSWCRQERAIFNFEFVFASFDAGLYREMWKSEPFPPDSGELLERYPTRWKSPLRTWPFSARGQKFELSGTSRRCRLRGEKASKSYRSVGLSQIEEAAESPLQVWSKPCRFRISTKGLRKRITKWKSVSNPKRAKTRPSEMLRQKKVEESQLRLAAGSAHYTRETGNHSAWSIALTSMSALSFLPQV